MLFLRRLSNPSNELIKKWIDECVEEIHTRIEGVSREAIEQHKEVMKEWLYSIWREVYLDPKKRKHLSWGFDIKHFFTTHIVDVINTLVKRMIDHGVPADKRVKFVNDLIVSVN